MLCVVMSTESGGEVGLRDYARILGRRKWTVVATAVLVFTAVVAASVVEKPLYSASARVLIQPSTAQAVLNPLSASATSTEISTDLQSFTGSTVTQAVRKAIGDVPPVATTQVATTSVIQVAVTSGSAQGAADAANAYATAFVQARNLQDSQQINSSLQRLQLNARDLQAQINTVPAGSARELLVNQLISLNAQIGTLQVGASFVGSVATVSQSAAPDFTPVSPKTARNAALGLILGLLVGCALAFLRDVLDDSVVTPADVLRATSLPTIGVVASVEQWHDPERPMVVSVEKPRSSAAEAYRALRTAVQFLTADDGLRILHMTSARAGEGKTTTTANLALALSRLGLRVTVVDADLRRPRISSFFAVPDNEGLVGVVRGNVALDDALQESPLGDGIRVLTAGAIPFDATEVLTNVRMADVLRALEVTSDVILVDGPPVLGLSDSMVLSSACDATIVLATSAKTSRRDLANATDALRNVDARILGVVLNAAGRELDPYGYGDGYGYGYGYGYGGGGGGGDGVHAEPNRRNAPAAARNRPGRLIQVLARLTRPAVAAAVAVVAVGAVAGAILTPAAANHRATATLDVGSTVGAPSVAELDAVLANPVVARDALSRAGSPIPAATLPQVVSLSPVPGTHTVDVLATSPDASVATRLAGGVAAALATASTGGGTRVTVVGAAGAATAFGPTAFGPTATGRYVALGALVGAAVVALAVGLRRRRGPVVAGVGDAERALGVPVIGVVHARRAHA